MGLRVAAPLLVVFLLLVSVPAQGQLGDPGPLRRSTSSVAPPAVSLAAPGDAVAVEVNPAAVALMPAWGLLYVHADAQGDDPFVQRGDAVYLGAPLPFGFGVGAHLASVRPTQASGAADRGMGSIALAFSPGPRAALGTSVRFIRSDDFADRHVGWDLSFALRPTPHVAFALMGHDLNALVDLTPAEVGVDASFALAVAGRPFGTDALTVEAAGAVDQDGDLGARGMVGVAVPHVGELRGVIEADDVSGDNVDLRVIAGLDVRWGGLGVGGGTIWNDDFDDGPGWYVAARLSGAGYDGLPQRAYVLDVESRTELGPRRILELQRKLDAALHDSRAAGVLLRLRSTDMSLADAQELRGILRRLEAAGKPVVCQLDAASGAEYYACAAASRTLIDPAGAVRLMGPSITVLMLGELFDEVGIRADFVRIGKYKSAPEQLTRSTPTAPAQEQREALLDDVWTRFVADLRGDLDLSREQAETVVDRGPYAAPEALEADIVAGAGDDLDVDALASEAFPGTHRLRSSPPRRVPDQWGQAPRVGVVVVDGTIIDGDNVDIPVLDIHLSGSRTVIEAIDRLAEDPSIGAIVLRVDSPGGSALAADKIWRAVRRARRHKPVVASLGSVAASGGYYIASAADEVWADPSSVTGSIGIYFGKVDVARLAERIGVHAELLSRGRHATAQSIWRPYTEEERGELRKNIGIWYRLFLERVAAGRGMEVEQVDAVGRGRIWSGDAAVGAGLVDRLGGFASALTQARRLGDLEPDAGFTVVPFRPSNLIEHVVGREVSRADDASGVRIPESLRSTLGLAATVGRTRAGIPLALSSHLVDVR